MRIPKNCIDFEVSVSSEELEYCKMVNDCIKHLAVSYGVKEGAEVFETYEYDNDIISCKYVKFFCNDESFFLSVSPDFAREVSDHKYPANDWLDAYHFIPPNTLCIFIAPFIKAFLEKY